MVAGLLYIIGLIAVLVTIAIGGYQAPSVIAEFNAATADNADLLDALVRASNRFAWALMPLVGGLMLMGFGRIVMLLGAIDRSLRRQD